MSTSNILKRLCKLSLRYGVRTLRVGSEIYNLGEDFEFTEVGNPPRDHTAVLGITNRGFVLAIRLNKDDELQDPLENIAWGVHELAHAIHHQGTDMSDEIRSGLFAIEYAIYREIGLHAKYLFDVYFDNEFPKSNRIKLGAMHAMGHRKWCWHHSMRLTEGMSQRQHDPLSATRGGVKPFLVDQCYRRPSQVEKHTRTADNHPLRLRIVEVIDRALCFIPGRLAPPAERLAFSSPELFYALADSELPGRGELAENRALSYNLSNYLVHRVMGNIPPYTFDSKRAYGHGSAG